MRPARVPSCAIDGYGQFCPVSLAAEVFARRWTPLIIRELLVGAERFNDLRRGMPTITGSVLARRPGELEVAGIVERRGTRYRLTAAGEELRPVVEALGVWGRRWIPTELRDQDLDPRLLVWDIHRNLRLDEIPGRTLIEIYFHDAPAEHRAYWLLVDAEGADVCLTHPGGDTDARLTSDVRTLTDVWMGNATWASAVRGGAIRLTGDRRVCGALPGWLKLSRFAPVKPAAKAASRPGRL